MEKTLFFKPSKKANEYYLSSFASIPMNVQVQYFNYLSDKGIDKLKNHQIIELAKKSGVIIDYNYSFYKTHSAILVNDSIYVCEQHDFTIASCLKTLYFLNIIN